MKKYMKGEFSTKKLNALEKDLNKIFARNKTSKTITFIFMFFSFLLFGFLNALTLRYISFETIDYSNVFILSELQELIDPLYDNVKLLVTIVLPFAVALVVGIFMAILIILMHVIKNIFVTGKSAETVTVLDNIDKIKQLIEKSRNFKNYYFDPFDWRIMVTINLLPVAFMFILLIIKDPSSFKSTSLMTIFCYVGITIVSDIPFCIYLSATHYVNSSLYNYSKKIYSIEKILDKWWVETDASEKAKRESLKEYEAKKLAERALLNKVTKATEKTPEHGPLATADNCGMPPIDVSDM